MIITPYQTVSLHTYQGVQLYQFLPKDQVHLSWSREVHEVSRCELTVPPTLDLGRLPDIVPWLHWISVWDGDAVNLLWTGPIQKVVITRDNMTISSRDVSALMSRTRGPITKKWDAVDPCVVAGELWRSMIEAHGLNVDPIIRPDPEGSALAYEVKADEKLVSDVVNDLVGLGLKWTVVAGTPILGPHPHDPVTAFNEADFLGGGLSLTRDGSQTFNDVLLRGADSLARKRIRMGGLNLQTIVHIDSMFGVSNTDRATTQYVKHTGVIHDLIALPQGAVLHPAALVSIGQLIPTSRYVIEAFGLLSLMQLDSVEVECASGEASVKVTMESVVDLPELAKLTGQGT